MVHEADDGADTVEWMRRQPWFTGRFATIGISYLGFTQYALLQDPPPELVTAVITAGPHDLSASAWGTGSFTVNDFLGWSNLVAHQEDPGRIRAGIRQLRAQKGVVQAAGRAPLGASGRALLGQSAPWWESWLTPPADDNPFWGPLNVASALDQVQVPVLPIERLADLFLGQALHQFRHLRDRGVDAAVTMGPWTHTQLLLAGLATIARETQEWLDTHLAGRPAHHARAESGFSSPARAGANCPTGHRAPPTGSLPPAGWRPGRHGARGGILSELPLRPDRPDPHHRGPAAAPDSGYRDDTALAARRDVLSFTSDVLTNDLYVHGNPVAELAHSSDNPYVDVFVRISEVDDKGRSRNVSDGYRRLAEATDHVSLDLDAISHRFRAGSRIRVLIAGGSHPRYDRNLGTGEATSTASQLKPATHDVHLGTSRIVLPVGS